MQGKYPFFLSKLLPTISMDWKFVVKIIMMLVQKVSWIAEHMVWNIVKMCMGAPEFWEWRVLWRRRWKHLGDHLPDEIDNSHSLLEITQAGPWPWGTFWSLGEPHPQRIHLSSTPEIITVILQLRENNLVTVTNPMGTRFILREAHDIRGSIRNNKNRRQVAELRGCDRRKQEQRSPRTSDT